MVIGSPAPRFSIMNSAALVLNCVVGCLPGDAEEATVVPGIPSLTESGALECFPWVIRKGIEVIWTSCLSKPGKETLIVLKNSLGLGTFNWY